MNRIVLIVAAVLATAASGITQQEVSTCNVTEVHHGETISKLSEKTCSRCQWECLTADKCIGAASEGNFEFTDKYFELAELEDCGDGYWLNNSTGLCVLVDLDGVIFDTQEQGCEECTHQCLTDGRCSYVIYNGEKITSSALGSFCPRNSTSGDDSCITPWEAVVASDELTILASAIVKAGLVSTLDDPEYVGTLFLPIDAAFIAAGLDDLTAFSDEEVRQVTLGHGIPDVVIFSTDFVDGVTYDTNNPQVKLTYNRDSGPGYLTVPGTNAIEYFINLIAGFTDFQACAAIGHVVDTVILAPPS